MATYKKSYKDENEMFARFSNFKENLLMLPKLRSENPLATFGVTKFFDMSMTEFKKYSCGGILNGRFPSDDVKVAQMSTFPEVAPASWDWQDHGAVTPVKNQEQCGSCWAFSTVGNLEGVWKIAGHPLTNLSEQEYVDCSTTSYGCSGGWPYWAFGDILKLDQGRVDTEISYPYLAVNGKCHIKNGTLGATYANFKVYCKENSPKCAETDMATLLYNQGPLSACLDATPFFAYHSGILDPTNCDPTAIDHCITITGYGSQGGVDYWRIKNSWGSDWGEKGYVRLFRGSGICGINVAITMSEIVA